MFHFLHRVFRRPPLKLIGYWTESLQDDQLPLPQELVGLMSTLVREAVCKYLTAGQPFEVYRGFSWCRFHCGAQGREMGSAELTDGEWVWPEGLVHYVKARSVVLPDEFIALATSGRKPRPTRKRESSLDFWIQWSSQRKAPAVAVRRTSAEAF
ncbi:MAG: hypothetical protein WD468_03250 [Pirellulales bacterium]